MKVVIEYVVYDLVNGEVNSSLERVKRQHEQKYGYNSWYEEYEKAKIEFFDKLKNNTKNNITFSIMFS